MRSAPGTIINAGRREWAWLLPWSCLLALLALNAAVTPGFLRLQRIDGAIVGALVDIALNGAPIVILTLGMAAVIATGGVDLSVGSVAALAGTVLGLLVRDASWPGWCAVAAGVGAGALCGLWNGLSVTSLRLPPVVATLVLLGVARGLAQTLSQGQNVGFADPFVARLANGGLAGVPVPIVLAALLGASAVWFSRRHTAGAWLAATGSNASASARSGVPARRVIVGAYMFAGLAAGVAGVLVAGDISTADPNSAGAGLELDAILAVVVGGGALAGGRPRIAGAIAGALIMQTLAVSINMWGVRMGPTLIVKALAIVLICGARSPWGAALLRARPVAGRRAA